MTDPAELLYRLGKAIAAFTQAALAQQLADGARLVVVCDLQPYAVRLILHRKGHPPLTLAALMAEMPPEQLQ